MGLVNPKSVSAINKRPVNQLQAAYFNVRLCYVLSSLYRHNQRCVAEALLAVTANIYACSSHSTFSSEKIWWSI